MTSDQYTELVGFLGDKFERIDRHFEQVDQRFEQVDQRFEQIDRRFEQVDRRFEQIDRRFEHVDRRFEHVDRRFEEVDRQLEEARSERQEIRDEARRHATVLFEQSQANLKRVAEGLELRLERAVEALTESVRRGFADHEGRIQVLERAGSEPED